MSLLQFEDEVMPFTFADILILRYLLGDADEYQTVRDFDSINDASGLNWAFRSQITKFVKRFLKETYHEEDKIWIHRLATDHGISIKKKLIALSKLI